MAVPVAASVSASELLASLAGGHLRRTPDLALDLGCNAEAVQAGIAELEGIGIELETMRDGAVRLRRPVELLDEQRIRAAMVTATAGRLDRLMVLFQVDSTNTHLLGRPAPPPGRAEVCLAELQTAGRGRQGRRWIAPFGGGLALSLSWSLPAAARGRAALSLAAGVAIVRALHQTGVSGLELKWPNDVWFDDRKLGGVLVELQGEGGGCGQAVIGVGLNIALSPPMRRQIESAGARAAAVADASREPPSRNRIAGALIDQLIAMLMRFEQEGFAGFRDEWAALDALKERPVRASGPDGMLIGRARGVAPDGALLIESGARLHRVVSGEVSLRLAEEPS